MDAPFALATVTALLASAPQADPRTPGSWRTLTTAEAASFDLGQTVFNTRFSPAGPSCDACHNGGRRGRGPLDSGAAPPDLVMQVGTHHADGRVTRGSERFGYIVNTHATGSARAEARVSIRYEEMPRRLADGALIQLRAPTYEVVPLDGAPLPGDLVLMPRMPPAVQGVGLLERVALDAQTQISRFGWQATEPSVASQIAVAFAREMGLTNHLAPRTDCGRADAHCLDSASAGTLDVETRLFDAVAFFTTLSAAPTAATNRMKPEVMAAARATFLGIGCSDCHRMQLLAMPAPGDPQERVFHPYTDLLLHDLGSGVADRDVGGRIVSSEWRTAPLWGLNASLAVRRSLRLLHDGRARSVEEAIAWHDGEAAGARANYESLPMREREQLVRWIESL